MRPGDFRSEDRKGIRVTEDAITRFVNGLQKRLCGPMPHPANGKSYALKNLIWQQAYQYKVFVLGEAPDYVPVTIR